MCSRWYVTIKGIVRVLKVCLEVYSFSWCYSLEATVLQSSFHFTAFCVSYLFFSTYIYMAIYFQFYLSIYFLQVPLLPVLGPAVPMVQEHLLVFVV